MESPLEVLSRAASLVQTDEGAKEQSKEFVYKRTCSTSTMDISSSELPTKLLKYDEMQGESRAKSPLQGEESAADRRCTGTQTQFSSFLGYPDPPSYTELNRVAFMRRSPDRFVPPLPSSSSHDGQWPDTPLNLSTQPQLRPSVITCASAAINGNSRDGMCNQNGASSENKPGLVDPVVEEHFRRSLGTGYPNNGPHHVQPAVAPQRTRQATSDYPSQRPKKDKKAVSITGSVDDHFAKSLGDRTWSAIKAKNDPLYLDMLTGSVDDHFSKALGDTWLRIKAEKESGCLSPSNSLSPQHPQTFMAL